MQSQHSPGHLIEAEFKNLCATCVKRNHCNYAKSATRVVIQCEMYSMDEDVDPYESKVNPSGLCTSCARCSICELSRKVTGTWICEDYL